MFRACLTLSERRTSGAASVHAVRRTVAAGSIDRADELDGHLVVPRVHVRRERKTPQHRQLVPVAGPADRDRYLARSFTDAWFAIAAIIHVAQVVTAVVKSIDVKRQRELARIALGCAGRDETVGQCLVLAVVVGTVAPAPIELRRSGRPSRRGRGRQCRTPAIRRHVPPASDQDATSPHA